VPIAVVFLLRAVVLVLLWGFVIAAVVAVRHDVFSEATPRKGRSPAPAPGPVGAAAAAMPAPPAAVVAPPKPSRAERRAERRAKTKGASRLTIVDGPLAGTSVALTSLPVTIGRAGDSTIMLSADDYVSNHHARLVPRGDEWLVEDTGSTNGTFLGDRKVTAPVVVPIGGRIRIGQSVLELQK